MSSAGGSASDAKPDEDTMNKTPSSVERITGAMFGALVGDAIGVPVEFTSRAERDRDPVAGMRGHGTWNQPAGTWSDDGALLLCTAESLLESPDDVETAGWNFARWLRDGHWAVGGKVFDVGVATRAALARIEAGTPALEAGGGSEYDNGNGSLMRILPVAVYHWRRPPAHLAEQAMRWSAITHRHPRSQLACAYYCAVVQGVLHGSSPEKAIQAAGTLINNLLDRVPAERPHFQRLLDGSLVSAKRDEVRSGGYVIDTLEAAFWCVLQGGSFADIVLRAVNLGGDTDTTGCVVGGLAGAWLGFPAIPEDWLGALAKEPPVTTVIDRLAVAAA